MDGGSFDVSPQPGLSPENLPAEGWLHAVGTRLGSSSPRRGQTYFKYSHETKQSSDCSPASARLWMGDWERVCVDHERGAEAAAVERSKNTSGKCRFFQHHMVIDCHLFCSRLCHVSPPPPPHLCLYLHPYLANLAYLAYLDSLHSLPLPPTIFTPNAAFSCDVASSPFWSTCSKP